MLGLACDTTRQCHPLHMIIPYTATSAYQGSFYLQRLKRPTNTPD